MSHRRLTIYSHGKRFSKKKKDPKKTTETRGDWEFHFYQKPKRNAFSHEEQNIKATLSTGSFDHSKIDSLMNPEKTKVEKLLALEASGKKLKSAEAIILKNHHEKEKAAIDLDIQRLGSMGLKTDVKTDIGRIRKLFMVLQYQLKQKNEKMIYYVYQKLSEFIIPEDLLYEYSTAHAAMLKIVAKLDSIQLQFTEFHGNMPPLNKTGFHKLDEWQIKIIENMNSSLSTIVSAPTSAGKSILSGYLFTKEDPKVLVVVPTDILCWQMAAMICKITGVDIPIVTKTHQTCLTRDMLISRINSTGVVVGTPEELMSILPFITVEFKWLIIDEIHMMGKKECCEMETIAKAYSDIPILALSATIGNIQELQTWFQTIGHENIDVVECKKRFFNLERFFYSNSGEDSFVRIHPLSMIDVEDISSGDLLKKSLHPTPPDTWDLAMKLKSKFDLGEMDPYTYFSSDHRVTLDEANKYFQNLLEFIVEKWTTDSDKICEILAEYSHDSLEDCEVDLVDLAFNLKKEKKTPALIFQTDPYDCLEKVRQFSLSLQRKELEAHPNRLKDLKKSEKVADKLAKKKEQMKFDQLGEKKLSKMMMKGDETFDVMLEADVQVNYNEPHPDFILNEHQYFSLYQIEEWNKTLKSYFPYDGMSYHFIIDLLYRGVGVYVTGMPDPYLRIIQNLACNGELAIVFSDTSLVFGVSMPFRTTVITQDPNIDAMMYHQMAGRAGRRGLDKKGNSIFAGLSWETIKNLFSSVIPSVTGEDTMSYGAHFASMISKDPRWHKIRSNFLGGAEMNEEAAEFYEGIEHNISTGNAWDFVNSSDANFNHMLWRFRNSDICFKIPVLLQHIRKVFRSCNPTNESTQIEFAKIMALIIDPIETEEDSPHKLSKVCSIPQDEILGIFSEIQLIIPQNIDSLVYESIRLNSLFPLEDYKLKSKLRERLLEFGQKVRIVQHYFHLSREINITRLVGKLLTRILWIYLTSSPLRKRLWEA